MGDFNHKSNFSNLPISYGDRIVVIIGVTPKKKVHNKFSPGNNFTPISVPIRGRYNDCGAIENVDMTPGVSVLEKFFNTDIENLVQIAERITSGINDQETKYPEVDKVSQAILANDEFLKSWNPDLKLELCYIMEHERIFDYIVNLANPSIADKEFG